MLEIDRLVIRFKVPLKSAGCTIEEVHREFKEMIEYASSFIPLSTMDYSSVWWKLFHSPRKVDWANALTLAELLFNIPASNGKVERVFSTRNIIKVENRSLLSNESLDDLLLLNTDKIPLSSFNSETAIELWWSDMTRRPNQYKRKAYKKRHQNKTEPKFIILDSDHSDVSDVEENSYISGSSSDDDTSSDLLEEWDHLFTS